MPIINRIAEFHADMTEWRRRIHANPETAFEEVKTAAFVAETLEGFGIEVHRGLARTGVVGTLKGAKGDGPAIGLRADMDALNMAEKNAHAWRSQVPGKMHACGHDGHTTMLLGAARYLAETRNFAGTVHFIFQPAEENEGGGRVMVEEGLFDRFPCETVWGMHNFPGQDAGTFAVCRGPAMAAADRFDIRIRGKGGHAAAPHLATDTILAGSQLVAALQTIASRSIDPVESVVVTVTQFHAGDAYNIIPEDAVLRGTIRSFTPAVQDAAEAALRRIAAGVAQAAGLEIAIDYARGYPPTVNDAAESDFAAEIAAEIVGGENVIQDPDPKMGAEDFSFMLQQKPGCYIWIGNGPGVGGCWLHNPQYDFNDEILPLGATYWARLAETRLAPKP
ncbi:MAG: amidohydrolase [Alphaproteobacteria bacterium]|nr:amidohydrolase [Alphaproteobacteria bacterium]